MRKKLFVSKIKNLFETFWMNVAYNVENIVWFEKMIFMELNMKIDISN